MKADRFTKILETDDFGSVFNFGFSVKIEKTDDRNQQRHAREEREREAQDPTVAPLLADPAADGSSCLQIPLPPAPLARSL
jgi:hypothetical protein